MFIIYKNPIRNRKFLKKRTLALFREGSRGDGGDEAEGLGSRDADLGAGLLRDRRPVGRRLGRRRGAVHVPPPETSLRPKLEPEQLRQGRLAHQARRRCLEGQVGERGPRLHGQRPHRDRGGGRQGR